MKIGATSSVGYDHIDVAAAKARGIVVTNTPGVLTDCTADFAFMMLLAAARRAGEYDAIMRSGWRRRIGQGDLLGVRVTGKRLGILGMGRIGRAMAKRAAGFDMQVLYHARHRLPPDLEQGARYFADLRAMLPECDFLSLHAPASKTPTASSTPKPWPCCRAARSWSTSRAAAWWTRTHSTRRCYPATCSPPASTYSAPSPTTICDSRPAERHPVAACRKRLEETRNAMGFRALDNIAAVLAGRPAIDPLWQRPESNR